MRDKNPMWTLALCIAVCFMAAGIGSMFTGSSVGTWYPTLRKPVWTPPDWVFGPVWTLLYLMMGVSVWLVWRRRQLTGGGMALGLFALQLTLNVFWSVLFFGLRSPLAGLVDIVLLWAAILATLVVFWRISPVAGALLVPYWLWVSFAAVLNVAIWSMNQ
jgi:tryptophan-rich sensory protein